MHFRVQGFIPSCCIISMFFAQLCVEPHGVVSAYLYDDGSGHRAGGTAHTGNVYGSSGETHGHASSVTVGMGEGEILDGGDNIGAAKMVLDDGVLYNDGNDSPFIARAPRGPMSLLAVKFRQHVNLMQDNVLPVEVEVVSADGLHDGYDLSIIPSQVSMLRCLQGEAGHPSAHSTCFCF